MSHGTEFVRDFCAGIGPLQLGVVLVYLIVTSHVDSLHLFVYYTMNANKQVRDI